MKIRDHFLSTILILLLLAAATVRGQDMLSFSGQADPVIVSPGESARLVFHLNARSVTDISDVGFAVVFPQGLVLDSPPLASTDCQGGVFTANAGEGVFSYVGGTVPAGTHCTVEVNVVAATPGDYRIVTGNPASSAENCGPAAFVLKVATPESKLGAALNAEVNGTEVTFDLYLENIAGETLEEISVIENLDAVFGFENFHFLQAPFFVVDPGSFRLNPDFDGSGDSELVARDSAQGREEEGNTLDSGATAQIRFVVDVNDVADAGLGVGSFQNQVSVSARSSGGVTRDLSDEGTNPNSGGGSSAGGLGQDDATSLTIGVSPSLGVACSVQILPDTTASVDADGVFVSRTGAKIRVFWVLENLGEAELTDVTLTDDLSSVFGGGNFGRIRNPTSLEIKDNGGGLFLNQSFNGSTDRNILSAGSVLAPQERAVIKAEFILSTVTDQGFGIGVYQNQAVGSAASVSGPVVTDLSDSGWITDSNGNRIGNEVGENDPTVFAVNSRLGLAKNGIVAGETAILDYYLEVFGSLPIGELSLVDNYNSMFGEGNYLVESIGLIDDPGTLVLNAAFNGSGDTELLRSGSFLDGADTAQIQVTIRLLRVTDQGNGHGVFTGNATVSGTQSGGTRVTDISDSGTDPDPNGNDQGDNSNESDPTFVSFIPDTVVGGANSVSVSGRQVTLDLYLENPGSGTASSIKLPYDLDAIFGTGNYLILTAPTFLVDPGTLLLNGSFDGSTDTALLSNGGTLVSGGSAGIRIVVEVGAMENVQGLGTGIYSSQFEVTSSTPTGLIVSDLSDDGTDADSNGNGAPNEGGENDPAVFAVGDVSLGLAMRTDLSGTNVTYTYTVQNLGEVAITGLELRNPLNPVFGSGNYSIASQPSLIEGPATLLLSPQYFGFNIFDRVIAGGSIEPGVTIRFTVQVNITNVTDAGNGFGIYKNQTTISGLVLSNPVTDISDDGYFPDSNGNGAADDAGEDDETTISIGDEARLGLAEAVSVSGTTVNLDLQMENLGASTLSGFSLLKDLDEVFGAGNYTLSGSPTFIDDPGTLTINPGFDGTLDQELLSGGTLATFGKATIRIVVNVSNIVDRGFGLGNYSSQSEVTATAPLGSAAYDVSDAGTDPDPNGNGRAFEVGENDPAAFRLDTSRIGLSMTATVDGQTVTFDYRIKNLGDVEVGNVTLTHDLDALFGAGNYVVQSGPTFPGSLRRLDLNDGFNGNTDTNLISGGTIAASVVEHLQVVVRVNLLIDTGSGLGVYASQAEVNATGSLGAVTDLSDFGEATDPNGNGVGNDAGEDDPTNFTVVEVAVIGISRNATVNGRVVTLDYYLENFGEVTLFNLSLPENLDAVFGAGNYTIVIPATLVDDPGTITPNGAFDGSGSNELLAPGSSLGAGETAQIRLVVEVNDVVDQGFGLGKFNSQVTVTGDTPSGVPTGDQSTSGTDPDPNGNGDPTEAGENESTSIVLNGSIGDFVWDDRNGDGVQDAGEPGLSGVTVFVDSNGNAMLDGGEQTGISDGAGFYTLANLSEGTYIVAIDLSTVPAGAVQTGGANPQSVTIFSGEDADSADFGFSEPEVPGLTVTVLGDVVDEFDEQTSLREALEYAATLVGPQVVDFSGTTAGGAENFHDGTQREIVLDGAELSVDGEITIQGPGSDLLSVNANSVSRVLFLPGTVPTDEITISGLTITGGSESAGGGLYIMDGVVVIADCDILENAADAAGGGISQVAGTLTITGGSIKGNTATGTGGGFHVSNGTTTLTGVTVRDNTSETVAGGGAIDGGSVDILSCLFTNNSSMGNAGAIRIGDPVAVSLINSTVSGNAASGSGGGVLNEGGDLTITQSTITLNGSSMEGGGVCSTAGSVSVANSILAGNTGGAMGPDLFGTFHDAGGNLVGNSDGATGFVVSALVGTGVSPMDPLLNLLADNGGLTLTHALRVGSPATDAGEDSLALDAVAMPLATDQRGDGFVRITRGLATSAAPRVDIGSFELISVPEISGEALRVPISKNPVDLFVLTGVSPSDGAFSGPGVEGNLFLSSALVPGDYILTYTVTDAFGVTNSVEFTVTVFSLPPRLVVQNPKRFAPTLIGSKSRVQKIQLSNRGGLPITGLKMVVNGKGRRDFRVTRPASSVLAPERTISVRAKFVPKRVGNRSVRVMFFGNFVPAKVNLSGRSIKNPGISRPSGL